MQKCYFKCKVTGALHRFPSSIYPHEERFAQWKKVLSDETKSRGDNYIKNNIRICSRHFERCYLTRSKKLTFNSVPTLDLSIERYLYAIAPLPPRTETVTTTEQRAIKQEDSPAQPFDEVIQTADDIDDTVSRYLYTNAPLAPRAETVTTTKQTVLQKAEKEDTRKVKQLKMKVAKLQAKCKTFTQRLQKSERQVKSLSLMKTNRTVPESALIFTKMQQQIRKKARGRRFTMDEKNFALKISKQSKEAYNLMKTFFVLPSKRSLLKHTEEKSPKCNIIKSCNEPLIDDSDKVIVEYIIGI